MDPSVKDALARWPNVPAVYGWLSLDARGRWRFHPEGRAAEGGPGESITNTQILGFIDRNYGHDEQGCWFFQNGPQRVYVRLDAAPWVLRLSDDQRRLLTHTGRPVQSVLGWRLDEDGRLYARTEAGAGVVLDRDLPMLLEILRTPDGRPLLDALEGAPPPAISFPGAYEPAPLASLARAEAAACLGFVADPAPAPE